MLLDLIDHHPRLAYAVIEPLIWRRDCRSLGALAGCCRQLRDFLTVEVHFWTHNCRMRSVLRDILAIERVILRYDYTVDTTVMFVNGTYVAYMFGDDDHDRDLSVYSTEYGLDIYWNLKDISIRHRDDCIFGNIGDIMLPKSILNYIENSDHFNDDEQILDIRYGNNHDCKFLFN
jgi:hypothetical protein